ncbi:MAG: adenosylcobinamide-GDP ribazoletransferase [Arcobacteraceae bacterium]|nr:adenosylcobinamide-GDP ribazoletransferase [Arcobacteraceae bacterium]
MIDIYLGFKFAFSYFTLLPVNFKETDDLSKAAVIKSMLFFLPFVGLVLGILTIILLNLTSNLTWLGLIISAVFYMVLYGFLHTEAVIDVSDALFAKHSGKDAYQIIKEPTVGAMGLLFGVSFIILKIAVLVYAFELNLYMQFVAVIMFSRFALLLNIKLFDAHEGSKFIHLLKDNISFLFLTVVFILYGLIGFSLISYQIILVLFTVILVSFSVVKVLKEKLGFVNGDILGTSLEISELIGLFIVIICF